MTPQDIEDLFTRSDGQYLCARWGRPIVPIVFGVEDATLAVVKGACEAVVALAGHRMAETDPEMGANLMVFFFRDWEELLEVPDLGGLVPGLDEMVARLVAAGANQYRMYRFEESGAIRACFVFLRMDAEMSEVPAEDLALAQMARSILLWSDSAFRDRSPLAVTPEGNAVLRPEIAGVIRAVYDPMMPEVANDPSHALRLFARIGPAAE
ncbi:hypothetical protein [Tropicimonas sediminicola]|uniref:Uncharacterized protein n=1 Tax=Tropicimonas sediminicola TaxID=1031541 RepID=A0A239LUM2_9RHOB|nr:hypothetical protein [Tropicimonas sediminicola]SNT34226.1 hypothetical protein SAMN05421757_11182 [Tropicimonas sediminicola]